MKLPLPEAPRYAFAGAVSGTTVQVPEPVTVVPLHDRPGVVQSPALRARVRVPRALVREAALAAEERGRHGPDPEGQVHAELGGERGEDAGVERDAAGQSNRAGERSRGASRGARHHAGRAGAVHTPRPGVAGGCGRACVRRAAASIAVGGPACGQRDHRTAGPVGRAMRTTSPAVRAARSCQARDSTATPSDSGPGRRWLDRWRAWCSRSGPRTPLRSAQSARRARQHVPGGARPFDQESTTGWPVRCTPAILISSTAARVVSAATPAV